MPNCCWLTQITSSKNCHQAADTSSNLRYKQAAKAAATSHYVEDRFSATSTLVQKGKPLGRKKRGRLQWYFKLINQKRCTSRMKAGKSRIMWASWENSPQSHPRFLSCSIAHISKFLLNSLLTLPLLRIAHQVTLQLCNKMPPDACNSVWRSIWEFTGALIVVGENS